MNNRHSRAGGNPENTRHLGSRLRGSDGNDGCNGHDSM